MTTQPADDGRPPPGQWLLEAGDDPWEDLAEAVRKRMDESISGVVLEIISWHPGIETNVAAWCTSSGHTLLHVLREGAVVRVWIKKGLGLDPDGAEGWQ